MLDVTQVCQPCHGSHVFISTSSHVRSTVLLSTLERKTSTVELMSTVNVCALVGKGAKLGSCGSSLTVSEHVVCCACRWSNLVRPAGAALQLTTNSTAYTDSQVQPSRRRQLLGKASNQAVVAANWLDEHSRIHGSYRTTNADARSTGADGTLDFSNSGAASNGSLVDGLTNSLILTGTSRWPSEYTVSQLHLSIIVLFVVVVLATVLQVAVVGLWKLFRLKSEDLPK